MEKDNLNIYKNMIQTLTKQKFEKQMEIGDDSILASPST